MKIHRRKWQNSLQYSCWASTMDREPGRLHGGVVPKSQYDLATEQQWQWRIVGGENISSIKELKTRLVETLKSYTVTKPNWNRLHKTIMTNLLPLIWNRLKSWLNPNSSLTNWRVINLLKKNTNFIQNSHNFSIISAWHKTTTCEISETAQARK